MGYELRASASCAGCQQLIRGHTSGEHQIPDKTMVFNRGHTRCGPSHWSVSNLHSSEASTEIRIEARQTSCDENRRRAVNAVRSGNSQQHWPIIFLHLSAACAALCSKLNLQFPSSHCNSISTICQSSILQRGHPSEVRTLHSLDKVQNKMKPPARGQCFQIVSVSATRTRSII